MYFVSIILLIFIEKRSCFVCFDLGFHTRNPVIKYRPDASCMSYMEARAEMPGENNSPVPIPRAQRVADRVHLRLAFSLSETRTRSAPNRGLPLDALPTELPGKGNDVPFKQLKSTDC